MTENNGPKSLKVWDPVVRIGHWVLVISVLTAYFVGDGSKDIHVIAGYTVAGIVVLRLVWGFIGTRHARFSDFVRGPSAVFGYLTSIFRGGYRRYVGHNPAGGAMIIALLFSLAVTTGSGMALLAIEHQEGPLAPLISSDTSPASQPGMNLQSEENEDDEHDGYAEGAESESEEIFEAIHKVFTYLTLGLAALHVLGVILSSRAHGENLAKAMITGRKKREVS
ncbi:MAG: cytochrome B [Ponticaulis sp.]|nr:cytochrome B [Ponticaulis sp.]